MCYLQGSSISVTMIKTSYFLYKSPNASSDAFNSSIPQEIQFLSPVFWSLPFSDSLVDQHHPSWIAFGFESKFFLIIVICKQKLACLQGFANCVLGGLCISPKQSQPRNLWNGHGVPCQTLPSAKFHCFLLKFERTPLEFVKNPKQVQLSRV